jgi:hypothetical protein
MLAFLPSFFPFLFHFLLRLYFLSFWCISFHLTIFHHHQLCFSSSSSSEALSGFKMHLWIEKLKRKLHLLSSDFLFCFARLGIMCRVDRSRRNASQRLQLYNNLTGLVVFTLYSPELCITGRQVIYHSPKPALEFVNIL